MEGGGGGGLYTYCYTVTTRIIPADESHFNVSVGSDGQSHKSPQTTTFEEKREPKRYRTEVLPLTSPTPYR